MCRIVLSLFLVTILFPLRAQDEDTFITRIKKRFLSAEADSSRNGSFILLPALGYAQESGVEYGVASTYSFFVDPQATHRRSSNITVMATLTTKKQKNIKLNSDIWSRDNTYHFIAELRYRDWPFNFYGIGNTTQAADKAHLRQQLTRAKIDIERKTTNNIYIGLNAQFDHFQFDNLETGGIYEQEALYGKKGGKYFALGGSVLLDSRDYTTYATRGSFVRARYAYAPNFWGAENFTGSLLELDMRTFYSPYRIVTLAAQGLYRSTIARHTPFYMYRELGGDSSMRGYYLGRYRDNNYSVAQAEIRYRPISRLGAVVFGGIGSTFSERQAFRAVASFGGGLRYFFSLAHNSSIRLDYAVGEKRPGEKRQSGFYLSLSEAF